MIFVTVGTDTHEFSRLVQAMDEIAKTKDVVMQIGHTKWTPKHATWFSFESNEKIDQLYRKANIIVTHGGAGSIIRSLKEKKIPIVVPRLEAYGEHINNHQRDLAVSLSKKGKVVMVEDVSLLARELKHRSHTYKPTGRLLANLERILEEYEA